MDRRGLALEFENHVGSDQKCCEDQGHVPDQQCDRDRMKSRHTGGVHREEVIFHQLHFALVVIKVFVSGMRLVDQRREFFPRANAADR